MLTTPVPGSTLPGASVTFGWTPGTGVSQYYLYVGSTLGANDLFGQSLGTALSVMVNGLPTDGRAIYVSLWSLLASGWQHNDYTYTALDGKAVLTTPVPGSTLPGASVTFGWTSGTGVSQYYLYVGSTLGANDLFGQSLGMTLSVMVNGLPTDGRTIYVSLWSLLASGWQHNDYTYTALDGKAVLTTPVPGSTLPGASVTFGWTSGTGVSQYYLYVGSTLGTSDLFSQSPSTGLSVMVSGLPTDGRTIYVRLWSLLTSGWQFNDYTYTASAGGLRFFPTSPCRLFDTRNATGADSASPSLAPGMTRLFVVGARCALPASAKSLSVNQTVTGGTASGELVLYPGDLSSAPNTSSISYRAGRSIGNNGILELARDGTGTFKVYNNAAGTVDFILDVNGYFQ